MKTVMKVTHMALVYYSKMPSGIIALMMEVVHTSETSIYCNETTQCYIPDSCQLYTQCRGNLKSHILKHEIIYTVLLSK
jgi:hypothetical protein